MNSGVGYSCYRSLTLALWRIIQNNHLPLAISLSQHRIDRPSQLFWTPIRNDANLYQTHEMATQATDAPKG